MKTITVNLKSSLYKYNKFFGGGSIPSSVSQHTFKAPKVKDSMYIFK